MGKKSARTRDHPRIVVVSSRTLDYLPAGPGRPPTVAPGGPAFYIASALSRLECACEILTGPTVQVQVVPGRDGEEYVIPPLQRIPLPDSLRADAVILSPIMNEIDPNRVPAVEGMLAVDVQGFVRVPGKRTGSGISPVHLAPLLQKAQVVKVSQKELRLLDEDSIVALGDRITLVTRGRRGAVIRDGGREYVVESRPVEVQNTIGAGDIFLSAFVCALLRGEPTQDAGHSAARFTESMLAERATPGAV